MFQLQARQGKQALVWSYSVPEDLFLSSANGVGGQDIGLGSWDIHFSLGK